MNAPGRWTNHERENMAEQSTEEKAVDAYTIMVRTNERLKVIAEAFDALQALRDTQTSYTEKTVLLEAMSKILELKRSA